MNVAAPPGGNAIHHGAGAAQTAVAVLAGMRLRDAGVAPEVVCDYLNVELDSLEGIFRMAEAKRRRGRGRGGVGAE